jgi:NitT/TauT family transport system substrate-binding protein
MNMTSKLVRLLAAAAAALSFASAAVAADKVSFRLSFRLSGLHIPYFWALEKGYFRDEGLDVDIKEGAGAQQTLNLIANKQDDIASSDLMVMANGVSKGMPVKSVFGYLQRNAWGVVAYADSGIRTPKDLEGRSVAVIADHKVLLDLLLRTNNVPPDRVTTRVVNIAARNTVFAEGKVDAFVGQILGSPMDFVERAQQGKGKPVYFMLFSDFGIQSLSEGLVVHRDTIARNPQVIRKVVHAVARAIDDTVQPANADEAVDIAIRRTATPPDHRESLKLQWLETIKFIRPATATEPLGFSSEQDWNATVRVLQNTGQIEKSPAMSDLYTNDFVR